MKQKVLLTLATALTSFVMVSLGAVASLQMRNPEAFPLLLKASQPILQSLGNGDHASTMAPIEPTEPTRPRKTTNHIEPTETVDPAFTPSSSPPSDISSAERPSASMIHSDAASLTTDFVRVARDRSTDDVETVAVYPQQTKLTLPPTAIMRPTAIQSVLDVIERATVPPIATRKPFPISQPRPTPRPEPTQRPESTEVPQPAEVHYAATPAPSTRDANPPTTRAPRPTDDSPHP